MKSASQQQGVALITALLIVALATIISVSISTQLQLDVRRTGNILASEQAILYAPTAEYLARRFLRDDREEDIRNNNNIDHYEENWATPIEVPVEGGTIKGQLRDLQACYNLNSLNTGNAVNDAIAQTRFRRLLAQLQADQDLNLRIDPDVMTQSIIDWISDSTNQLSSNGAEDIYYMNLEKPYRTANAPIQSISELRVIRGFEDSKTFDALQNDDLDNLVCAFGVPAFINVNTAPAEVLESLAANINADDIIKEREINPFNDINDFITRNNLQTTILAPNRVGLSVSTNYFLLETIANIGQARTLMYSIIQRQNNGDTTVIARSQGAY